MQVKKEELNKRIRDAALNEFLNKGYENASIRAIARAAGMTSGNIYSYYSGKEDIFCSVLFEATQAISSYLKDVSKGMQPNMGTIEYLSDSMTRLYLKYKKEFIILMNKSAGTKHEKFREELCAAVADRLNKDYFSLFPLPVDPYLPAAVANSFIEGIFTVFDLCSTDEKRLAGLTEAYLKLMFAAGMNEA